MVMIMVMVMLVSECMCVLAFTLVHSLIHDRLIFYKCLFLCLVLMVMVSEKLGLALGFDGDGNACFCVYVLVNRTLCWWENYATALGPQNRNIIVGFQNRNIILPHTLCWCENSWLCRFIFHTSFSVYFGYFQP